MMRYEQTPHPGLKRTRFTRFGGAFMAAAAFLLFFIDFFHFAFHIHSGCRTGSDVIAYSLWCVDSPLGLSGSDPDLDHASFCPVCEGILISDGPPPDQCRAVLLPQVSDPILSGTGGYAAIPWLSPRGRAPPSVL